MKNPKIKRGTLVKLVGTPYGYSKNPESFNINDYEVEAVVEWPTTRNINTLHYGPDGGKGIADVIVKIKGGYSWEKHDFTIGGTNGPKTHKRVAVRHEDLVIL